MLTFEYRCFINLDLSEDGIYLHFLNNHQTSNHHSIIYGIRELNFNEINQFCSNETFDPSLFRINQSWNFSSDYQIRIYQSGCFYLDLNNNWQSDGLVVRFYNEYFFSNVSFLL